MAGFLIFKPKSTPKTPVKSAKPVPTAPAVPAPTVKTFSINIAGDQSGTNLTFKANQGDQIVFKITSDRHEEFHLHGYDKIVELAAGKTAELPLTLDMAGKFIFELEDSSIDIGSLEVQPKS